MLSTHGDSPRRYACYRIDVSRSPKCHQMSQGGAIARGRHWRGSPSRVEFSMAEDAAAEYVLEADGPWVGHSR